MLGYAYALQTIQLVVVLRERKQTGICTTSLSNFVYNNYKAESIFFFFSISLTMISRLYFMTAVVFRTTGKVYFSPGRKVTFSIII